MTWQHYKNVAAGVLRSIATKRRYSITANVLAYRRCSRQYGFVGERRYQPALAVQMYYGTVIHQVLDMAHAHFNGQLDPTTKGILPTDDDIASYFDQVENGLKARQIHAARNVRDQALTILQKFNRIEGPDLYPRVIDTECRLQSDQGGYILNGVVDVLASAENAEDSGDVEIWDYKGAYRPSIGTSEYQDYRFQMLVYAELYRQKVGRLPASGVLYFLNELHPSRSEEARPVNAVLRIPIGDADVAQAVTSFATTVQEIEQYRQLGQWPDPTVPPPEETCDACDFRWNCAPAKGFGRVYRRPHP